MVRFRTWFAVILAVILVGEVTLPALARGGGGAVRAQSRSSIGGGGNRGGDVNRGSNVNRNQNVNRNTNVNQNVNVNRNVNVNTNYYGGGGGCCYHPVATAAAVTATAVVTAAVVGSIVNSIPDGCTSVVVNGLAYQQCGSTWYQPQLSGSTTTYVVVNAPR